MPSAVAGLAHGPGAVVTRRAYKVLPMVEGYHKRFNLVLCFPPPEPEVVRGPVNLVLFFPGDVSDMDVDMVPGSELRAYSLEKLGDTLRGRLHAHDYLAIIRPASSPRGFFAHYTNFLGGMAHYMHAPMNVPPASDFACKHLAALLATFEAKEALEVESVTLVGFSKGCSVLRALMDHPLPEVWRRVRAVHFLDAGGNEPGVFPGGIPQPPVARPDLQVTLHATPRQIDDRARRWIREEWDAFPCARKLTYPGTTLADHFNILSLFEYS
ncbi:hypothetical protein DIPPA_07469 [Diplonema papillatum]|nr:hypothetical protein DIPPA_07469 [Diplonema papillatum]